MQNKFTDIIEKHEAALKKNNVIFNAVGYVKLLLLLLLGISIYFFISKGFPITFVIISAIISVVLIVFWGYHDKLERKINRSNGIIAINKRHLDRLSGQWVSFKDTGEEYIDNEHNYASDLDIVGKKSLFQFLNTTGTWFGRQAFAKALLRPDYSAFELKKRQDAVFELSRDIESSVELEYLFSKIGADDFVLKLVNELKHKAAFIKSKAIKSVLTYVPLVTLIFIAAAFIFRLKYLNLVCVILLIIQGIIWLFGMSKALMYLGTTAQMPYKLSLYSDVIEVLQGRKFTSEKLCQIQAALGISALSAAQAIRDLSKISDKINYRHNGIMCLVLNIFFLWDYQCAFMLEQWREKYALVSEGWFLTLGEFESLLSLSSLPNVCNNTCLPVISDTGKAIEAKSMGHPLLQNELRVDNNYRLNDSIFIISGSNMSGKTTFLRTVGINLVLAQAGGFVCAEQMTFSPVNIVTSMRIADDLSEGVSTFYAELKRIKGIIELAKKDSNTIFLIDEIFRGTNSVDRLSGAQAVISRLNALGVIGIITTHDLTLCDLANQHYRISNYSFSEHYKDNKILFDYKLKPGKSNTTNAKYLMEMLGISD